MNKICLLFTAFVSLQLTTPAQLSEFKLLPSDGSGDDLFGGSVSISGDYVIVGAPGDNDNGFDSGSAYIFKQEGSNWLEEQKLTASDGIEGDYFGDPVSISGDYAIVGAIAYYGSALGSAYIFKREGSNWSEEQKLTANDGAQIYYFGHSLAISGDYVIVGAITDTSTGLAYIFKREGSSWSEEQKLTVSIGPGSDAFGISVSIAGDYAIIGVPGDDDNGYDSGSAYIFKREGSNWFEEQKLTASDASLFDEFGSSVSISGNYALVGAEYNDDYGHRSGSAYIFKKDGSNWIEEQKLTASDGSQGDFFGFSVSISGDYVIVGAIADDDNGSHSGSAYIFRRDDTTWIEEQKLIPSDGAAGDGFGIAVSISQDYTIIGATGDDDNGSHSGSAYIYSDFVVGIDKEQSVNPGSFKLFQNYPNPFNPTTKIKYSVPQSSTVIIKVFNLLGNEITTLVNEEKQTGTYELTWYAANLPSGIYFYRLQADSFIQTKKMILMK